MCVAIVCQGGKNEEIAPVQKSVAQQMVLESVSEEYHTAAAKGNDFENLSDEKSVWGKVLLMVQSKKKVNLGAFERRPMCWVQGRGNKHRISR